MISREDPLVEYRYANWLSQAIAYIGAKDLQVIAGRGTSKTTAIHAERFQEALVEMPRSIQMFLCNTYENARTNLVPGLETGWREFRDWKYGVDYVKGERPPSFFAKPYMPVENFKKTIYHRDGGAIIIGSAKEVTGLAGNSYQYLGADEVKFIGKEKMDIILPALRGFNMFPHSAYYRGTCFTTDLPNLSKGDDPWILDYRQNMKLEQVKLAYYCGYYYYQNERELAIAMKWKNREKVKRLIRKRARLYADWLRVRRNLSYFVVASSFANIDVLTIEVIADLMKLGWEEFKQSVLSLLGGAEEGDKFYSGLSEEHFYRDGINEDYDDRLSLNEEANCHILRYLDISKPIDAGVDFGKMLSMVIGQQHGKNYRVLKNKHVLAPQSSRELANWFIDFFKPHKYKRLNMYYDRSGNQYASSGRDWATEIKNCIEVDSNGVRTGWQVQLMNKQQATIYQSQEFLHMKNILSGQFEELPRLLIDAYQCRELKSSLELSKILIKTDRKGSKQIHKDKSSEDLPIHQLPMHSTNYSDAFKYLMYRKEWAQITRHAHNPIRPALDGM